MYPLNGMSGFRRLYLIWLGIQLLRSSPRSVDTSTSKMKSYKNSILGGLSLTLGNPKVIVFYLSFLPTFVRIDTLPTLDVVLVASVASLVLGSVLLFYAYTASRTRELFKSTNAQKKMNKALGPAERALSQDQRCHEELLH